MSCCLLQCSAWAFVIWFFFFRKHKQSKREFIKVPKVEDLDLSDTIYEQFDPSPLPVLRGKFVAIASFLANTLFGKIVVLDGVLKSVGLYKNRVRTLPEKVTYRAIHPIPNGERPMEPNEKCENLQNYYENVILKTKRSKIRELKELYESGKSDPVKICENIIGLMKDDACDSIVQSNSSAILAAARVSKQKIIDGNARRLEGMPFCVKENVSTKGYMKRDGLPIPVPACTESAAIVDRLLDEGAVCIGISNMHQLGIGVSGVNPSTEHKGGAKNPYDLRHFTSGSSSGTASAIASGLVPFGIGNDGGGSIRMPSAACGISGIKATWGRISSHMEGGEAYGSVTHAGPMASCIEDLTFLYGLMAGKSDRGLLPIEQPVPKVLVTKMSKAKVGYYNDWVNDCQKSYLNPWKEAVEKLSQAGIFEINYDVKIPELKDSKTSHNVTILSEFIAGQEILLHNHLDEVNTDTVTYLNGAGEIRGFDYIKAAQQRTRTIKIFNRVFEEFDVDFLITPTLGVHVQNRDQWADKYLFIDNNWTTDMMTFVHTGNFTGMPVIQVPVCMGISELTGAKLPIGLSIHGKAWEEHKLLAIARQVEEALGALPKPKTYYEIY